MTSDHQNRLLQKLRKRPYRRAYVGEHIRRGIAHQIRALREDPTRNWNQGELSKRLGKPQSVVSRMEDPSYGKLTVQTLLEVAEVFDVALSIQFVSWPTFIIRTRDVSEASMRVESFDQSEMDSSVDGRRSAAISSVIDATRSTEQFSFNRWSWNTLLAQIEGVHGRTDAADEVAKDQQQSVAKKEDQELLAALAKAMPPPRGSWGTGVAVSGRNWSRHQ